MSYLYCEKVATAQLKLNQFLKFKSEKGIEKVLIVMALKQESNLKLEELGFSVLYTGVGLINAALKLERAMTELKPDRVINLGTAGSFSPVQGQLFEVESCVQRGDVLPFINKKIDFIPVTDLPKASCGSADFVETKKNDNSSYNIMDMELYALAKVCLEHKTPIHSFKVVTDFSDANTVQDWKNNLSVAQEHFVKLLKSWL